MSSPKRILVAGVGNIFLGDDAFGSEVARRLMHGHFRRKSKSMTMVLAVTIWPMR